MNNSGIVNGKMKKDFSCFLAGKGENRDMKNKSSRAVYFCADYNGHSGHFWIQDDEAIKRNRLAGKSNWVFVCGGKKVKKEVIGTHGQRFQLFSDYSLRLVS